MLLPWSLDGAVLKHVDERRQVAATGFDWDEVEIAQNLVGRVNRDNTPALPRVEVLV
jgi:hypothetical protein